MVSWKKHFTLVVKHMLRTSILPPNCEMLIAVETLLKLLWAHSNDKFKVALTYGTREILNEGSHSEEANGAYAVMIT